MRELNDSEVHDGVIDQVRQRPLSLTSAVRAALSTRERRSERPRANTCSQKHDLDIPARLLRPLASCWSCRACLTASQTLSPPVIFWRGRLKPPLSGISELWKGRCWEEERLLNGLISFRSLSERNPHQTASKQQKTDMIVFWIGRSRLYFHPDKT